MTISQLFKTVTAACFALALTPDCHAQSGPWYQRFLPSYYFGNNRGYQNQQNPYQYYQYPYQYQNQYPEYGQYHQPQPAPEPAYVPEPQETVQPHSETRQPKNRQDNSQWLTDFNTAWARACKQGRPLVALFVHHGCPECDRMDATLSQPAAQHTLDSAVKARIEFTENADLVNRFGLKFTPTFLVFSPASQGEVYREVGALSLDRLRQLQPSIDSLVTGPASSAATSTKSESKTSRRQSDADDMKSTRTVAAL